MARTFTMREPSGAGKVRGWSPAGDAIPDFGTPTDRRRLKHAKRIVRIFEDHDVMCCTVLGERR